MQSQVVVITFLCVVCCIMMLATIAVCTVNILTMAGRRLAYRYCGIYPALHLCKKSNSKAEFDVKITTAIRKITAKWYLKKMVDELTYLLSQMSYGNMFYH